MENFDTSRTPPGRNPNEPIPFDNSVSHSPLDLSGGGKTEAPKIERPAQSPGPTAIKSAERTTSSAERVTGVKTFFTKLHGGAMEFLDEIIAKWLKDNPGISIKHINMITGEIQGKKTEPNIIITVWY